MIMKNPEVKTWVLKIDDEFGGRGVAYVDFEKSKVIQRLLEKSKFFFILVDYGEENEEFFATNTNDISSEPQNQ